MAGNSTRPRVSVTSRVLDMFAAYDEEHRSLTLTGLARRAGLPLAFVVPSLRYRSRLLSALRVAARGIGRSL